MFTQNNSVYNLLTVISLVSALFLSTILMDSCIYNSKVKRPLFIKPKKYKNEIEEVNEWSKSLNDENR